MDDNKPDFVKRRPSVFTSSSEQWSVIKTTARDHRKEMTEAEQQIWTIVRGRRLAGLKFRRQHAIGRFIVDFICIEHKLIVEVDGKIHESSYDEDKERQNYLQNLGYKVIRFSNDEVTSNILSIKERIINAIGK
jgi:5-methyltetrahydrofolate--homocysteine methyltransferase